VQLLETNRGSEAQLHVISLLSKLEGTGSEYEGVVELTLLSVD
jgi:hypothetical protein